jgi:hypothetical protein
MEFSNPSTGECRRRAPLPYIRESEGKMTHKKTRWPLTAESQVCGEFKPIERSLSDSDDTVAPVQIP